MFLVRKNHYHNLNPQPPLQLLLRPQVVLQELVVQHSVQELHKQVVVVKERPLTVVADVTNTNLITLNHKIK